MPPWFFDVLSRGGPYALCVPLAGVVVALFRESIRQRDRHEETLREIARTSERHAAELAAAHARCAEELAEVTRERLAEMARITAAAQSLGDTARALDRLSEPGRRR